MFAASTSRGKKIEKKTKKGANSSTSFDQLLEIRTKISYRR